MRFGMAVVEIKIRDESLDDSKRKEIKESCPTDVYEIENGKLVGKRPRDCIRCNVCESICGKDDIFEFIEKED
jgi:NAD-dependent dihydropyrimidine dehydrogenase PreA subunit